MRRDGRACEIELGRHGVARSVKTHRAKAHNDMDHQDIAASVLEPKDSAPTVTRDELQSNSLLRALEAGWTTPEDLAFVVPILAWVHSVLVEGPCKQVLRDEGENSIV